MQILVIELCAAVDDGDDDRRGRLRHEIPGFWHIDIGIGQAEHVSDVLAGIVQAPLETEIIVVRHRLRLQDVVRLDVENVRIVRQRGHGLRHAEWSLHELEPGDELDRLTAQRQQRTPDGGAIRCGQPGLKPHQNLSLDIGRRQVLSEHGRGLEQPENQREADAETSH